MGLWRYGGSIAALTLVLLSGGCSDIPVPLAKPTTGRAPMVAEVPEADETVRGAEDPPIVNLNLKSRLRERRLTRTEDLPGNIVVPSTNLNAVPVTTALQAVLAGTDVSLSWNTGAFDDKLVSVINLSGPLPRVVDKICNSAKVFCSYRHGLLELKEKETFVIELPAVPSKSAGTGAASNSMADAISELAGEKVKIDQQGGNLIYTTDVDGQESIREYLDQLRNGRPLIVMQLYIWEVNLDKENGAGINWNNFKFDALGGALQNAVLTGSTAFTSISSPGVSLGAKFSGHVDAETVIKFLATQGQVQTISSPQLTFVSGSNAEFRVGGKQKYISEIGQLTSSNVSGSTNTNTSVGNNTISTDTIETGLTIEIGGSFESGVISAILELTTQDLISLNPTSTTATSSTNSMIIDLPETSERKVSTTLRVRPGDNLVLAGLVSSRDTNTRDGIPTPFGVSLPTSTSDALENNELVILVKPSVVLFTDAPEEEKPKEKEPERPMPPLDAVVIDKDGAKVLKLPDAEAQPITPYYTAPAAMAQPYQGFTSPYAAGPFSSGEESAPVDKNLMQRGFSSAFEDVGAFGADSMAGDKP